MFQLVLTQCHLNLTLAMLRDKSNKYMVRFFLKNGVFQGERQHTMYHISAATTAATSASGHHVLRFGCTVLGSWAYLITLNP